MNMRKRLTDDRHCEELYARRIEIVADPPRADETTSKGRVVFHTVWLYYRDGAVIFEAPGPRLEYSFDDVLPREWNVQLPDGVATIGSLLLLGTLMSAFDVLANEHLASLEEQLVPMPPPIDTAAAANPPPPGTTSE